MRTTPALLALEDGSLFHGYALGAEGTTVGEVVFNTSMTGYQEILTDPSYSRQMVTLTYPHIGNTGINPEDEEAAGPQAAGLIVRHVPARMSSWRAAESLPDYLKRHGIVAITGVDTRRLTRLLREKGAQNGCIMAGEVDEAKALEAARAFPGINGMDLAKTVTTAAAYEWTEGSWALGEGYRPGPAERPFHVVCYDFGVKRNMLRLLADRGCRITVVPGTSTAEEILALNPDGVLLSNGPGDPAPCDYAIRGIQGLLEKNVPLYGICLGHQLLGLSVGAKSVKMKFGHHGANHPVQDLATGKVMISSQNHGFAIDEQTLPGNARAGHRSLFDGTLQGIELTDRPALSFQGHPEASPGPEDVAPQFDRFIDMMRAHQG
ncbi:glutamine-hydrolyzing carbamoyl-phosphate synthase small subunit [Ectothiorhodospira lacustris]|uniref:glutamine-hydrolyzing carbamoyl-phosphate synthase small subunit n=1 Tax=Ectothiorhodospira lacustris TaxID=2899127 RepID=UPI001EE7C8D4|nr:glutamine-hydrolyzing carbamoyl-phosphate synthase small subunit [Ectothiorhodospira lacustris]MCG5499616.1 glutamine-hydrolyzing carbamoyl-phosphate synthase small subunit [Ectothiorhodospira lacustris]MCG5508690.1 glutamine-hydrolyzing carbamoyl-phosphate synthase small subunit [Ectothiorhodospira lacustris]MCG5520481.1 glutamine-hydrolyzing carbamoyl-phosphate synthase small subunit [Ectothiorhodospira lacustris]